MFRLSLFLCALPQSTLPADSSPVNDGWTIVNANDPAYWSYASDPLPARLTSTVHIVDPQGAIHATLQGPTRQQITTVLETAKAKVKPTASPFTQATTARNAAGQNIAYPPSTATARTITPATIAGQPGATDDCPTGT